MIRSPSLALAAELFSSARRGYVIIAALLAAAAALSLSSFFQRHPILAEFTNVGLVISLAVLFGLLNYTEHHPKSGLTGFPNRLFTLPVSTFALVTCPILCGVLLVTALYAAWVLLVFRPMGRQILLAYPAVVLACGMVCYLAILWSLAAHRLSRLIVLSLLGTVLVTLAILPYVHADRFSESRLAASFIATAVAAYFIALAAIHRQRHGGGVRTSAGLLLQRLFEWLPTPAFRSPGAALFWLEFRRGGLILPIATLFILLMVILLSLLTYPMDSRATALTFLWIAPLPLVLAAFVGKSFSSDTALPTFISIRPVSAGDILLAKLRAAALSVAVSWLILLIGCPLWLLLCDTAMLKQWWQSASASYPSHIYLVVALLLLSAVLFTWKFMIASTPTGLWGRSRLYYAQVYLSLALVIAFFIITPIVIEKGASAFQDWPILRSILSSVPLLIATLILILAVKISLAICLWDTALSRRLIHPNHAWFFTILWVLATAVLAITAHLLLSTPNLITKAPALRYVVPLAALYTFPLARIPLAAIALAGNRHR